MRYHCNPLLLYALAIYNLSPLNAFRKCHAISANCIPASCLSLNALELLAVKLESIGSKSVGV